MSLKSVIIEQLDREAELTQRALESVPEGLDDWKPHPKSMPLGQLAHMIASMPSWISMIVKQDELDVKPKGGKGADAADFSLKRVRGYSIGVTREFCRTVKGPLRCLRTG